MKVTPKTETEIAAMRILPLGWYPFTIDTAEEKLSKAAKDRGETEPNMIELNIRVYRDAGFVFQKDWLMEGPYSTEKLYNCAKACGVLDTYEAGDLTAESLEGKEGYVKLGIEKAKPDSAFGDKNKVLDYATVPPPDKEAKKAAEHARVASGEPRKTVDPIDAPEDDGSKIPF